LSYAYTRATPPGWTRPPGRIDAALIAGTTWPASLGPTCYVCGPTSFVENAASLLTACGHRPDRIRTERFGPTRERKGMRTTILTVTAPPVNWAEYSRSMLRLRRDSVRPAARPGDLRKRVYTCRAPALWRDAPLVSTCCFAW